MHLLKLDDKNKITIHPEALMVKEYKAIWDRDKSKGKKKALKEISFIYYNADYKSPFSKYDDETKNKEIRKTLGLEEGWEPDSKIKAAIDRYNELQKTPSLDFLESVREALNRLKKFYREVDFFATDKNGKPIYDVKKLTGAIKDSKGLLDNINDLEEKVKQELETEGRLKGGEEKGYFEDPDE